MCKNLLHVYTYIVLILNSQHTVGCLIGVLFSKYTIFKRCIPNYKMLLKVLEIFHIFFVEVGRVLVQFAFDVT